MAQTVTRTIKFAKLQIQYFSWEEMQVKTEERILVNPVDDNHALEVQISTELGYKDFRILKKEILEEIYELSIEDFIKYGHIKKLKVKEDK